MLSEKKEKLQSYIMNFKLSICNRSINLLICKVYMCYILTYLSNLLIASRNFLKI